MSDTNEAAHPLPAGNAARPMPFPPGKLRRAGIIAAAVAVAIAVTGIVIREIKAHEVASWTYAAGDSDRRRRTPPARGARLTAHPAR